MAESGGKTATYTAKVETNAGEASADAAAGLEKIRTALAGSMTAIKDYGAQLRSLRGSSDEVKELREKIKSALDAERTAVSANTVALAKEGTSYDQLTAKMKQAEAAAKKLAEEQKKHQEKQQAESLKKLEESMKSAGGPAVELRDKISGYRSALSTSAGQAALAAGAIVAVAAAAGEAAKAITEATISLGKWIFESALAQRQANLQREAWTGSAENATHLGHQLDALAEKINTPREKLQELAGATVKALNNSRVSGQGIVDTYNAVAESSAAMGDETGRVFQSIIEGAKNSGRVSINPFQLQGTGVGIQDIAAQLAKRMKVGVNDAIIALQQGRVGVNDAAAAIRATVEARFGEINSKIKLGEPIENLKKRLAGLFEDVHVEGLLKNIESLESMLDKSTVSGDVLRTMLGTIGTVLGAGAGEGINKLKDFIEKLELGAIRVENVLLKAAIEIKKDFAGDYPGLRKLAERFQLLTPGVGLFSSQLTGAVKMLAQGAETADRMATALDRLKEFFDNTAGAATTSLVDGLVKGMTAGNPEVANAVKAMGQAAKDAMATSLESHSPSRAFERYGEDTTEGYAKGVSKSSGKAQGAVDKMAPGAPKGGGGAPATASKIEVHIHLHGGGDAKKLAADRSFRADLTKAVLDALIEAGLPVQQ